MTTDRYPAPTFDEPHADRFVYVGWSVAPPRLPRVQADTRRHELLTRLTALAPGWEQEQGVAGVGICETRLIAPIPGAPRLDVLFLARATSAAAADRLVEAAGALHEPQLVMRARNTHRYGDTEGPGTGTFLFNHFAAPDPVAGVDAWERAAAWYVHEMGVDNTTLLQPDPEVEQSVPYPLINFVQAPCGPVTFLRRQLLRRTFHTYVRPLLREQQMTSYPILARRVRAPHAAAATSGAGEAG